MINDLFNRTYEKGALIIKPAGDFEIGRCQKDLRSIGVDPLPEDYIAFLKIANGFSWNGFEFFGTYQITVKKTGYVLADIANYNYHMKWLRNKNTDSRVILGCYDGGLFCYNTDTGKYESLDDTTLDPTAEYDSFEDLLAYTVLEYLDYLDGGTFGGEENYEEAGENFDGGDENFDGGDGEFGDPGDEYDGGEAECDPGDGGEAE